jgi:hypothetical protein
MFCRKLILSVTDQSTAKSEFYSSLHDNLELFISSKSVANLPVWMIKECLESSQTTVEHQQTDDNGEKVSCQQEEKHPHADNPKLKDEQSSSQGEVKHQHADRHETSLDTGTKGKKVMATIKELFRRQDKKKSDDEDNALEKEMRLFKQKQQKVKWKETKNHHQRLKWAKEILEEDVIPPALAEGRKGIEKVVSSILDDLTPIVIKGVEGWKGWTE